MSWFHFHKWQVKAVEHMQWIVRYSTDTKGTPCTEVLLACDCGKVKTKNLDGHWALKDLKSGS